MSSFLRYLAVPLLAGAAFLAPTASAQTGGYTYRIAALREMISEDSITVNKKSRRDLPKRIEVILRVGEEMPAEGIKVKAYFYDKEHRLVYSAPQPNAVWGEIKTGVGVTAIPETFKKSEPSKVYFALPQELMSGKWKSVVVVFGKGDQFVARAMPASALAHVEFPEKAIAVP